MNSKAWWRRSPKLWIFVLLLGVFPLVSSDGYFLHVLTLCMLWTVFASSWNLSTGYAGLKTFGHQAFFGIGAYVSALVSINYGLTPWLTLWIGALAAALLGFFVGLPMLRIKSLPHAAIVTLAVAEIVRITCSNLVDLTRGELGLWGIPAFSSITVPLLGVIEFGPSERMSSYYLAWILMFAVLIFLACYVRSKSGLLVQSIRDSQVAAESLGVDLTRQKLTVFTLSAFIAGIAGAFYAHYVLVLTPTSAMGLPLMIQVVAITLIGGIATLQGPLIGAFLLTIAAEGLRVAGDHRMLIFGGLIIVVVLFVPRGLARLDLLKQSLEQRLGNWRSDRRAAAKTGGAVE